METVLGVLTREVHSRCCSRRNDNLNVNTQLGKKSFSSQASKEENSFPFVFYYFFFTKQNPGQGTAMQDMRARARGKWPKVPAVNRSTLVADSTLLQLESGVESKRSGRDVHTKSRRVG